MTRPIAFTVWPLIWTAVTAVQAWGVYKASQHLGAVSTGIAWIPLIALTALQLLLIFALWKLSRWPVVIYLAGCMYNLIAGFLSEPSWRERYPLLGPFVLIILMAIFAITVLPHWKKMTWRPLGRNDFGSPKGAH